MPSINETQLKKKLKSDPLGAYLLFGEEQFLVKVYTERLIKATVKDSFADFNLHIFDSDALDLSDVYDACISVPMMNESKCVVVKSFAVETAEETEFNQLESILRDNPPDNCLIFSYPVNQPTARQIKPLASLFEEYGTVVEFKQLTGSELHRTILSGAENRGCQFANGASEYFIESVGEDLNLLGNELDKLCAYCEEEITREDIDAVCSKTVEAQVFPMIAQLVNGNFDVAFGILGKLFKKREDVYMIMGALISQYADMFRVKATYKAGKKIDDLIDSYPNYKSKRFALDKAKRAGDKLTIEEISKCIEILVQSDLQLKSTGAEAHHRILEQTLVLLAGECGGRK